MLSPDSCRYRKAIYTNFLDLTDEKKYCDDFEVKEFKSLLKNKQPLPEDIYYIEATGVFFRYIDNDIPDTKINQLLMFRKATYLQSIRNCLYYFVALSLISVIVWLIVFF